MWFRYAFQVLFKQDLSDFTTGRRVAVAGGGNGRDVFILLNRRSEWNKSKYTYTNWINLLKSLLKIIEKKRDIDKYEPRSEQN